MLNTGHRFKSNDYSSLWRSTGRLKTLSSVCEESGNYVKRGWSWGARICCSCLHGWAAVVAMSRVCVAGSAHGLIPHLFWSPFGSTSWTAESSMLKTALATSGARGSQSSLGGQSWKQELSGRVGGMRHLHCASMALTGTRRCRVSLVPQVTAKVLTSGTQHKQQEGTVPTSEETRCPQDGEC